jgi:thiol:disulfide interchange protein DsbD
MIKQMLFAVLFLLVVHFVHAQNSPDPVHWTFRVVPGVGDVREVRLSAQIERGWHIYAQVQPKDAISQPTTIRFHSSPLIHLQGQLNESGKKETYVDKVAGITQYQYADSVAYTQSVLLRGKARIYLSGTITYQACTEEMCLPPKTITFRIAL